MTDVLATTCAIVTNVSESPDAVLRDLVAEDHIRGVSSTNAAISVGLESHGLKIENCRITMRDGESDCVGIRVRAQGQRVVVRNCEVFTRHERVDGARPYECMEEAHLTRFENCSWHDSSTNIFTTREMFSLSNVNGCLVKEPVLYGATKVVLVSGDSSDNVAIFEGRKLRSGFDQAGFRISSSTGTRNYCAWIGPSLNNRQAASDFTIDPTFNGSTLRYSSSAPRTVTFSPLFAFGNKGRIIVLSTHQINFAPAANVTLVGLTSMVGAGAAVTWEVIAQDPVAGTSTILITAG